MRRIILVVGATALLGSVAYAEETPADLQAAIEAARAAGQARPPLWVTNPNWTRRPDGNDVFETYPLRARNEGLRGAAVLVCRIGDRGELKLCIVDREEPSGQGFGDAALKLSRVFRMRDKDEGGAPVAGRLITLPIIYRQS